MTKRTLAARAAAIATLLATALLGVPTAPTASAGPPVGFQYDALGDSYASGYGVPPYGACGRSQAAYGVQLDGRMKVHLDDFVACAGARTGDIAPQLAALDSDTDLVTISVGGNDVAWNQAVLACLAGTDQQCTDALAYSRGLITNVLPSSLASVYAAISAKAPNAFVVVTGYPRLFSPQYGDFSAGPLLATVAEQKALNDGADLLNSTIARAAAPYSFRFVDVTKRFLDHGVNAPVPWINGPFPADGSFHPNSAGYEAYTAAVTAAVVPARLR